jgi:hypothetical protein
MTLGIYPKNDNSCGELMPQQSALHGSGAFSYEPTIRMKLYPADDVSRETDTKRILDAFDRGQLVRKALDETKNQLNASAMLPVLFGKRLQRNPLLLENRRCRYLECGPPRSIPVVSFVLQSLARHRVLPPRRAITDLIPSSKLIRIPVYLANF